MVNAVNDRINVVDKIDIARSFNYSVIHPEENRLGHLSCDTPSRCTSHPVLV